MRKSLYDGAGGPAEIFDDRRSTWDRAGNLTSIETVQSEGPEDATTRVFTYDSAYRLIASTNAIFGNATYELDGVGQPGGS